jgi:hypothetical protein
MTSIDRSFGSLAIATVLHSLSSKGGLRHSIWVLLGLIASWEAGLRIHYRPQLSGIVMKKTALALAAAVAFAAPAYAQDAAENFPAAETGFSRCLAKRAKTLDDYFVPGIGFIPGKLIANCYGEWWRFHNACLRTGAALSECAGLTNALALSALRKGAAGDHQQTTRSVGNVESTNPSFNCDKARTQDERVICNDSRLAELDQAESIAYSQAEQKNKDDAGAAASDIHAARHSCGGDRLCILDQQVYAIIIFSALGSQVPVPPWIGTYRVDLFRRRSERRCYT